MPVLIPSLIHQVLNVACLNNTLKSFKDSVLKTPGDSDARVQVRGSSKIFLKSYYKISTMLPASEPKSGSQSLLTRIGRSFRPLAPAEGPIVNGNPLPQVQWTRIVVKI
ncbi:hypothetical protein B0H13DRAFT_1862985 [Mycena leptocephala]|nr:hypothetical protein B0H13DRAFT_1862985 [Mycena leptocephala]